jgi:hypothetical protein
MAADAAAATTNGTPKEDDAVTISTTSMNMNTNTVACIERIVPFTKDMLHGHVPVSLYVHNLPLTPDGTRYAITMPELRDLFTPLLLSTSATFTTTTTTTTSTTANGEITLIKFKFKPRSSKGGGGGRR